MRKHAAILVAVLLFGAGAYALYHLLAPLDLRQVLANLRTTSTPPLTLAIGATVIGYLAAVGYDLSALQYIGKRLPLPTVMLGGFLGYERPFLADRRADGAVESLLSEIAWESPGLMASMC